jgi:hypothetical protein
MYHVLARDGDVVQRRCTIRRVAGQYAPVHPG